MTPTILLLAFLATANAEAFMQYYHLNEHGIAEYINTRYLNSDFFDCEYSWSNDLSLGFVLSPLNLNESHHIEEKSWKGNSTITVFSSGKKIAQLDVVQSKSEAEKDVDVVKFELGVQMNRTYRFHNKYSVVFNHTAVSSGKLELFYSISESRPHCRQLKIVKGESFVREEWIVGLDKKTVWSSSSGEGRLVEGSFGKVKLLPGFLGKDHFEVDGKTLVQQKLEVSGIVKTSEEEKKGSQTLAIGMAGQPEAFGKTMEM